MFNKILQFLGIKQSWDDTYFILGLPSGYKPGYRSGNIMLMEEFFPNWNRHEIEKRKDQLRLRRETIPAELPSISLKKLDKALTGKDSSKQWKNLFDKNFSFQNPTP